MSEEQGPLLGEGKLQVTKKGREVVYTTTEVIHKSPSKCNLTHHCTKVEEEPVMSDRNVIISEEKQISPASSIEDVASTPVISQVSLADLFPVQSFNSLNWGRASSSLWETGKNA